MKTLRKVTIEPVFVDGYMPPFSDFEDGKVYISKQYGTSIHKCLCGCGEQVILPIDKEYGWQLVNEPNGTISFTPSVGNYSFPCKSHYIITKNIASFC